MSESQISDYLNNIALSCFDFSIQIEKMCQIDDFEELGSMRETDFRSLNYGFTSDYRLDSRSTSVPLAPACFCPEGQKHGLRFVPPRSASILGDNPRID